MKGIIVTIYNLCTEGNEEFYFLADVKDDLSVEVATMHHLASVCYCDEWEFVSYKEVPEGYEAERNELIKKYEELTGLDIYTDFTHGFLNEYLQEEIERKLYEMH